MSIRDRRAEIGRQRSEDGDTVSEGKGHKAEMGEKPADRVKTLLVKLDSVRRCKERGFNVSEEIKHTSNKFIGRVEKIFKNLPKPLEWLSFMNNDLPILMDISKEVQKISIQNGLNRSQTRALETLKTASVEEFQRVTACGPGSPNSVIEPDTRDSSQLDIKDLSAREIEDIVEKLGVVQHTVNNWISDIRKEGRSSHFNFKNIFIYVIPFICQDKHA